MLLEEGIPSVQRRTRGFDVPDFLAAGPARHPRSGRRPTRTLAPCSPPPASTMLDPGAGDERPLRLLIGILIALAIAAVLVWALSQIAS